MGEGSGVDAQLKLGGSSAACRDKWSSAAAQIFSAPLAREYYKLLLVLHVVVAVLYYEY